MMNVRIKCADGAVRKLFVASIALLSLMANSKVALGQAGDLSFPVPHVRNYVGAAVGVVPDYAGSNDFMFGAAPAALIRFGDTERYIRVTAFDVNVNVLDSETWSFGPALNYRWGRKDVDDPFVGRMREIDGTIEVGAFVGWTWIGEDDPRNRFSLSAEFLYDVGGVHNGFLVNASASYFLPVLRPLMIGTGVSVTYASGNYADTYFGVSAFDSFLSGLNTYDPNGGFRDVKVPVMAVLSFSETWHLAGGAVYSRMLQDFADSPVTSDRGSKNQFYFGLGVAYAW